MFGVESRADRLMLLAYGLAHALHARSSELRSTGSGGRKCRAQARVLCHMRCRAVWQCLQAGLALINAVFTYRQRAVREAGGRYDEWHKHQRSAADPPEGLAAAASVAEGAQAAREERMARAAAVAQCIHGMASPSALLLRLGA